MRRFSSVWDWGWEGKALVVDRDSCERDSLRNLLQVQEFRVLEAADGEAAILAFRQETPSIVLLDLATVGVYGYSIVRRIKDLSEDRFIPLILLATPQEEDELFESYGMTAAGCLEIGGDDFLTKPVSSAHLSAKIAVFGRVAQLYRTAQVQRDQLLYEQELAKQAYAKAAMADPARLGPIHSLQRPASVFSGDILLAERSPSGSLYVLVGDFTGHGLAAAIGALPAADVFRGMTAKGFTPSEIFIEINRKLRQTLPTGMFLAAALVCLDEEGRWAGIRNSGLPDVLILGPDDEAPRHSIPSNSIPLGIRDSIEPVEFQWVEVRPGDQIVAMTDGIVESRNRMGEFFGEERLRSCLSQGGGGVFQRMVETLDGFIDGAPQDDDLTLAVVPCGKSGYWPETSSHARAAGTPPPAPAASALSSVTDWRWSLDLRASALKRLDVVPLLVDTLVDLQGLREFRQPLFTVLSELFNNALDHGVLRLESKVKNTPEGYFHYFTDRRDRLAALEQGRIRISLVARIDVGGGALEIEIEDDGPGFDFELWERSVTASPRSHSGRGIGLVRGLCESLRFEGAGNVVKAVYRW